MGDWVVENCKWDAVDGDMIEIAHGLLEMGEGKWVKVSVREIVKRRPGENACFWIMGEVGGRGIRVVGEILDKICGVRKGDDCKILLDRCDNGLPDRKGVEPAEEGGKIGLLIRHGWVNDALGKVG